MGKNYITNAFSINMLSDKVFPCSVQFDDLTECASDIKQLVGYFVNLGYKSCVGHKDLANIVGVEFNRESITLNKGDTVIIIQYRGERLPEGTTELPEEAELKVYKATVN